MQKAANKNPAGPGTEQLSAPGLLRRVGAIVYDSLLLLAVLFFATAIALPFNAGKAFTTGQIYYPIYLLGISFFFYGWFWRHGGQTLGMRAWKIKIHTLDGRPVGWNQAGLRFAAAMLSWGCFGMGFLWCLFDKSSLCWHDHLSKTRLSLANRENNGLQK